ncbi:MAG TPA: hypothetical protein VL242_12475 [Sorangium sp.]|nr:hypothetical protein [Sorangium sp.]
MGMTLLRTRIAALTALAWGSACGGNVVVDGMPDGSGGAGSTSTGAIGVNSTGAVGGDVTSAIGVGVTSTTGSWTNTAAVTTSSTGVGGGDARSLCVSYCELFREGCGIGPGSCSSTCDEELGKAPQCNDLLAGFFECAIGEVSRCDAFPDRCQEHLRRYDACAVRPACGPLECFDDRDAACRCKGSCEDVEFAVECYPWMPTGVFCSCFIGGREVASCQDAGPACDLAQRCCGPIFSELR